MKFYSEVLKKLYDSEKELNKAEEDYRVKMVKEKDAKQKEKEERAKASKEVKEKLLFAAEARKEANEALMDFTKKYGRYHLTLNDNEISDTSPFFSSLFNFFDSTFF